MSTNLINKIALGTFWTVLMRISIRLLGVISILILARILTPEDYGLIAKAILLGGFLDLITQFGFGAALIKDQHSARPEYDTVWTLSIIRSLFLALVMIGGASLVKDYFNEPRIEALIYWYALAMAISGFNNVGVIDFQKHMNFDKDFKFNVIKKLASFLVTIMVALKWETYWAFPIGVLTGSVVGLITSFIMSPYRPALSLQAFNMIFNFSKWMFLYEILSATSSKLDTFLLSKFGAAEDLGLYTISYEVAGIPSTEVAMPVARASLPGLAKLSHDIVKFQKMNVTILSTVLLFTIPAVTGLSLLAEDVSLLILGENWIGTGSIISILAIFGITRVIQACSISSLIAFDRADILGKFTFITLIIKVIILPFSVIYYGYIGLAYGVLISGGIGGFLILAIQHKLKCLNVIQLLLKIGRCFISSIIMAVCLFYLELSLIDSSENLFALLMMKVFFGMLVFILTLIFLCIISGAKDGPEIRCYQQISMYIKDKIKKTY